MKRVRRPGPLYVIPGATGLVVRGNIDLFGQPAIRNPDGTVSTVDSRTYPLEDGPYKLDNGRTYKKLAVLCSSVYNGRHDTSKYGAFRHYAATGKHLGIFDTEAHANSYGSRLHLWYVKNAKWFPPPPRRK